MALTLLPTICCSQSISYFNHGFLRQTSAAQDRAYLGISGTNAQGVSVAVTAPLTATTNGLGTLVTIFSPNPTNNDLAISNALWSIIQTVSQNATNQGIVVSNGVITFTINATNGLNTAWTAQLSSATNLALMRATNNDTVVSNGVITFVTGQGYLTKTTNVFYFGANNGNPADSTSYFVGNVPQNWVTASGTHWDYYQIAAPCTGTIIAANVHVFVGGTLGSSESVTLSITNITAGTSASLNSITMAAVTQDSNTTGLSFAMTRGDYIVVKVLTPAWVTNPVAVAPSGNIIYTQP